MLTLRPVRQWPDVVANFDAIKSLFKRDLQAYNFGTQAITFPAASSAGPVTVTHGLGTTPVAITLTALDATVKILPTYANLTPTTFDLYGRDITLLANSNTYTVSWRAEA